MPTGLSLHIGLNRVDPAHYAGWSGALHACEADAEDMAELAAARGFAAQKLLTQKATRNAVVSGILNAAAELKAGDMLLVTYSGHGGQVPDLDGDEADLQDETWCLYDGELIDDELRELWAKFGPKLRILVVSDSCLSGTVTRAAYDALTAAGATSRSVSNSEQDPPAFRAMPVDAAFRTYRANRAFYQGIAKQLPGKPSAIQATVRLISGCQDNQLSLDGTFNGLFTGTLLQVWGDGQFKGDYRRFHSAIVRRMPPTQSPNHFVIGEPNGEYDRQTPFTA